MKHLSLVRGITLAALAAAACTALHADGIKAVGIHIGSQHFPARDFNNFNPGAYVRLHNGLTAGAYYNSERRPSTYIGHTSEWGPLSATVGVITGYRGGSVLPMLIPSIRVGRIGPADLRLVLMPQVERAGATAIHLMAEF